MAMAKTKYILGLSELTFVSVAVENFFVPQVRWEWAEMALLSSNPVPLLRD